MKTFSFPLKSIDKIKTFGFSSNVAGSSLKRQLSKAVTILWSLQIRVTGKCMFYKKGKILGNSNCDKWYTLTVIT